MVDTVTMTGNTGSATLHDFANIFVAGFPPCPGHTTHGHLPGPGDGHNVLSFHDHAGTHGHVAQFGGCPTHAFGHTAGLLPEDEGTMLPALNSAVNQDGTTNSDPSLRQFAQPAPRGSVVTLYGPADGFQEGDAVEAFVGETPARVLSSGPLQGAPGTWMVQVEVPADALVGPASHVRVISGGREVQAVDIAVN